ncbi:hypothetical protein HYC85_001632 [Camellia sinensis]|uniref:14-3-3 domain-containing protein n=1 Tax=Camellia sinensis TaxID=4442 RepID=A0A7J7I5Z8_CAMSI|nr:hypothetical protein HYC85_001632 [Camellia sinensis]
MAKPAQQANCYIDTVNFMEKLIINSTSFSPSSSELIIDEHNLLSTATTKKQNHNDHFALVTDYKSKIESELSHLSNRVLNLLDKHLIPSTLNSESEVFYLKMKGDYYRYMTEFKRKQAAENTIIAYKAVKDIALCELDPTLPTKLVLALNFSIFHHQIEGASNKACSMAREAYEEAIAKLDSLGSKSYKETSLLILQLMRDNLSLWFSDIEITSYSY